MNASGTSSPDQGRISDEDLARLASWNDTAHAYPSHATVHGLFDLQAEATPDQTALIYGDQRLSFVELQGRANALSHHLVERGVGPGVPVGVSLYRSPHAIVAMLAVMKAGGAYLPLDPTYPAERLSLMVEDSGIDLILTSSDVAAIPATRAQTLDIQRFDTGAYPSGAPLGRAGPDDAFYVVFTSGSTGRPNGVLGTHRGAINRFHWAWETYPFSDGEVCCQKTSLNFVDHVAEVWAPLLKGHPLVIIPDEVVQDGPRFVDALAGHGIERLVTVPSLMATLLRAVPDIGSKLSRLRYCTLSGERLTVELASEFNAALPDTILLNLYGMSEGSADATWYDQRWGTEARSFPIGRPIHNMRVYVLDPGRRLVPIGEAGEIYLGGVGLAQGYLGQPALTEERFLPEPFVADPGARMYRTGDVGRWLPEGALEFVGRVDNQVKVRGVRVELGDVEAAARSLEDITDAVVTAPEIGGERRLVAYLIRATDVTTSASSIRDALSTILPGHMVPGPIVFLDRFPLTPNGKVDRSALPSPIGERPQVGNAYAPPRTDVERELERIWRGLLFIDRIGVNDNFFDLGGDSLLVVRLQAEVHAAFGVTVAAARIYEDRTIRELGASIEQLRASDVEPASPEIAAVSEQVALSPAQSAPRTAIGHDIAIIGMAGRFPGAPDVERFWDQMANGREGLRRLSEDEIRTWEPNYQAKLRDPDFVPVVGTLNDVELFDAEFFGIQPGEARTLDPQHRIWFETARDALENGGYAASKTDQRVGVFAGSYMNTYAMHNLLPDRAAVDDFVRLQGAASLVQSLNNEPDYLPTRTSHLLDLRGPSINVQTACSTALVAVVLACRAIASGDCEMALAGGVTVMLPQAQGYYFQSGGIRSADGHCRPFDAAGTGTIFTSGAGAVLLKGLEQALADGDNVLAVIRGAAMNNDGAHKASYMAPSIDGQSEVILDAQRRAGIDPDTISYVEAHGTATPLGDPIEVAALTRAFQRGARHPTRGSVALGAVKSNIGHTDAAAGIAGLIKVVLSLTHEAIPPTLHFETPNPEIDFDDSPFYVPRQLVPWPAGGGPRRAGISSFGVGGTNAHVVVEEVPARPLPASSRPRHLLTLSARTDTALATMRRALADHLLAERPVLADVAYTLMVGRDDLEIRQSFVAGDLDEAVAALRDDGMASTRLEVDGPDVVMMFPGQGTQFVGMGQELYQHEPVYRDAIDRCASVLEPLLGLDIREVLYPADTSNEAAAERLTKTGLAQPAIFTVSYATAILWQAWGVRPSALLGHSVGEYVAAAVAGVFALEDALTIIASRATLMQDLPGGSMRAVRLSPEELARHLGDGVSLAAVNTPTTSVVSGPDDAIRRFEARMASDGLETIELHTSHAFHSEMMEPILDAFRQVVASAERRAPGLPIISTLTGRGLTDEEATDPEYWVAQLRQPVRFSDAVMTAHRDSHRVYLEVGPGTTLSGAVRQHPNGADGQARVAVIDSLGHPAKRRPALETMLEGLGRLWQAGAGVDLVSAYGDERRYRVPLPTYPYERKRHWVDPPPLEASEPPAAAAHAQPAVSASPTAPLAVPSAPPASGPPTRDVGVEDVADRLATIIAELGGLDAETIDRTAEFGGLGLDSLFLTQVNSRIRKQLGVRVPLRQLIIDTPTIVSLAERIGSEVTLAVPVPLGEPADGTDPLPSLGPPETPVTTTVAQGPTESRADPAADPIGSLMREQLRLMDEHVRLMHKQLEFLGPRDTAASPHPAVGAPIPRSLTQEQEREVPVLPNVARYLTERETPRPEQWNLDALVTPTRRLDADVLRRAVALLVERHDAFRLRFSLQGDVLRSSIAATAHPSFGVTDLGSLTPSDRTRAVERRAAEVQTSLRLDGRLIHFELFDLGEQAQRLLVVAHHFVLDQVSWQPFWADLEILYTALESGTPVTLAPVTTTFRDWALALQRYADSETIRDGLPLWRGLPWDEVRPIPLDHVEGPNSNASAQEVSLILSPEETEALQRRTPTIARKADLMVAALARAIAAWTGVDTVLIDTMGHGRDDGIAQGVDPLETVGFFISYTPLLLRVPPGESRLAQLTDQIEPLMRRGLDFDLLRYMTTDPGIRTEFRALPRADVLFNHHGQRDEPVQIPRSDLFLEAPEAIGDTHAPDGIRYYPVAVSSELRRGTLRFNFVYSTNLHERSTIEALVSDFHAALREAIRGADGAATDQSAPRSSERDSSTGQGSGDHDSDTGARIANQLAEMICVLSGLDARTLDPTANFADLGLDSLFLTQLGSRIRQQLGVRVTLRELLEETPTITSLSERIAPRI